jgi:hypothetical protein
VTTPEAPKRSSVDVQTWTVRRLVDAIDGVGNERIFIPSFQRGFVWKESRQQELIESIRTSQPIGSLLFYDNGIQDGKQQYQIVDGLQRSTTLRNYEIDVFTTYTADEAEEEFITSILDTLDVATEQQNERRFAERKVRNTITAWVRARRSFEARDGFRVASLLREIGDGLGVSEALSNASALDLCEQYLERLRRELEIGAYQIPVVVFAGDRGLLPDIFEKLNTRGVKLNKFDILASSWSDRTVDVQSEPIRLGMAERRRELEKGVIRRAELKGNAAQTELFDAVCGFGIVLSEEFPDLFVRKRGWKASEPLSCAFNLVALSFGISLSHLDRVPDKLGQWQSIDLYFQRLLEASDEVARTIRPTCLGDFAATRFKLAHTELQMASLVASVFRAQHGDGVNSGLSRHERSKMLRQHYLWDAIRREWTGTGDTKAVRAVLQERYSLPVSRSMFFDSARAWYNEHLADARNSTKNWIDPSTLAFLRAYLFASGIEEDQPTRVVAVPANPNVSIAYGTANIVSNVKLTDLEGHVLIDPGTALPALPDQPTADQVRHQLERRFNVMLDKIALAYQFENA